MIAKQKPRDPNGWVLAVNTKSKKLEQVRSFSAERLYFHRFYLQCAFSKHLSKAPGVLMESTSKGDQLPFVFCVTSILVVQHLFRKFDKSLTCYSEVWPLLHGHFASIMNIHIQQVVEYADRNGQGEAPYNAVAIYKQATKEIDIYWENECAEAVGNKIDAAVGAIDESAGFREANDCSCNWF